MPGPPARNRLRRTLPATCLMMIWLMVPCLPVSASAGETKARPATTAARLVPRSSRLPMAGVCLAAPGRSFSPSHLDPLVNNGTRWISLTPFGWQRGVHSTHVGFSPESDHVIWGESDQGLGIITKAAHARGQSVLLSPHIWLMGDKGKWRGDIEMVKDGDWQQWFKTYRTFILHYARLAQKEQMEMLSVGLELTRTTLKREKDWRHLIKEIRQVYRGALTYSANWYQEADEIRFWDALDFIGIQAYFPLGPGTSPDLAALQQAWSEPLAQLKALSQRTGKPILFTEVGYKSSQGGTAEPWLWQPQGPVDLDLQARAYQALFNTFWKQPWFAGVFIWKWHLTHRRGGPADGSFTPQGKPALAVMKRFFTQPLRQEAALSTSLLPSSSQMDLRVPSPGR